MKRKLEVQAKKAEDAIENGLKELGLTIDDVEIKILSTGGFLKKAKVEIYYEAPETESPRQTPANATAASEPVNGAAAPKEKKFEQSNGGKNPPVSQEAKAPNAKKNDERPAKNVGEEKRAVSGEKAAVSLGVAGKSEPKSNSAPRREKGESTPKQDEPRWGVAPQFNREPSMASGFGKSGAGQQNAQRQEPEGNLNSQNAPKGGAGEGKLNRNDERAKNNNNNSGANRNGDNNRKNRPQHKERETIAPTAEQTEDAVRFLTAILEKMGVQATVETKEEDGLRINLVTEDSRVIGYRGEVLDSLQYLVSLRVNTSDDKFVHVSLDGLDYRNKRKGNLEALALRMADKAQKTNRKVSLEPMNSSDRRIIHAVLGENEEIITRSEGHEPMRHIVILPKKKPQ